jgi:hypothetical protein
VHGRHGIYETGGRPMAYDVGGSSSAGPEVGAKIGKAVPGV